MQAFFHFPRVTNWTLASLKCLILWLLLRNGWHLINSSHFKTWAGGGGGGGGGMSPVDLKKKKP